MFLTYKPSHMSKHHLLDLDKHLQNDYICAAFDILVMFRQHHVACSVKANILYNQKQKKACSQTQSPMKKIHSKTMYNSSLPIQQKHTFLPTLFLYKTLANNNRAQQPWQGTFQPGMPKRDVALLSPETSWSAGSWRLWVVMFVLLVESTSRVKKGL